jgi:hypothetical protein
VKTAEIVSGAIDLSVEPGLAGIGHKEAVLLEAPEEGEVPGSRCIVARTFAG